MKLKDVAREIILGKDFEGGKSLFKLFYLQLRDVICLLTSLAILNPYRWLYFDSQSVEMCFSILLKQKSVLHFNLERHRNRKDYRPQLFDKIQIQNTKPFMVTHVYSLFWVYGLVKTTNDWNQHMCILKLSVHDFYFFLIFGSFWKS